MARIRRRRRRPSTSTQLMQIAGLLVVLVIILLFRTQIGAGAGNFFSAFDAPDVQLPEEPAADEPVPAAANSPQDEAD